MELTNTASAKFHQLNGLSALVKVNIALATTKSGMVPRVPMAALTSPKATPLSKPSKEEEIATTPRMEILFMELISTASAALRLSSIFQTLTGPSALVKVVTAVATTKSGTVLWVAMVTQTTAKATLLWMPFKVEEIATTLNSEIHCMELTNIVSAVMSRLTIPFGLTVLMREAIANVMPKSGMVLKSTVNQINPKVILNLQELQMEELAPTLNSEILYTEQ